MRFGGAEEDRTPDLLRARQALSQLSYGPNFIIMGRAMVGLGGLEPPTSPLSGVRSNHLSYRPGFACLRTAWTALQLSLNRSRTCVRSLFHSTCALPAAPNPAPNPETDSVFVANRYRACIDPFALFISQPSNSCGL